MYMCTICVPDIYISARSEESARSPGTKVYLVVCQHVGTGNGSQVLGVIVKWGYNCSGSSLPRIYKALGLILSTANIFN